jgi:hypothetical protein
MDNARSGSAVVSVQPAATRFHGNRLSLWRSLTLYGNFAREAGNLVRSRQLHEEALGIAEELFGFAVRTNDREAAALAPTLFGSSCSSVIEIASAQGDSQTRGIFLYRKVELLLWVAEADEAPIQLRLRCLLHLKVASVSLSRYFDQHGMWDAASAYTERTNAALFRIERVEAAAEAAESSAARPPVFDVQGSATPAA